MLLMKKSVLSFESKKTQLWFTYFQIAGKFLNSCKTNPLHIISTISVYDFKDIGRSSVVYIFHKGISSYVLCGYEEQMHMYVFDFERKSMFNTLSVIHIHDT